MLKPKFLLALAVYCGAMFVLTTRLIAVRMRIRKQTAADRARWEDEGGLVANAPDE